MLKIAKDLMLAPGAETDPSEWLTRFYAHKGVGGDLFAVFLVITSLVAGASPGMALFLAGLTYALVELVEFLLASGRRTLALAADCFVDWLASFSMSGMLWAAWSHSTAALAAFCVVSLVTAQAGVLRRRNRRQ